MPAIQVEYGSDNVGVLVAETRSALRALVERLPEPVRQVAAYHLGWRDEEGRWADCGAGRMIRSRFALTSAMAVGGHARSAIPAAIVVELVHNFSLLHDDVEAGDEPRPHRRDARSVFGTPAAVLAGDALWTVALEVLIDSHSPPDLAVGMLVRALRRLLDGRSADLGFQRRGHVSLSEGEVMAAGRTGAMLGCACELGALFGGGSARQIDCLRRFGERFGVAFQLADDLRGIRGDPAVTGGPAALDPANRKKTLPVLAALNSGTRAGEELAALYRADRPLTSGDIAHAAELVEEAGGLAWAEQRVNEYLAEAMTHLSQARPVVAPAAKLSALANELVRGEHGIPGTGRL